MGIIIHSLESVSFKDLYAAFSSAFKDYDFSLNADELRRMLDRRGPTAVRTTARTAAFMPGASPPLVRTPILLTTGSIIGYLLLTFGTYHGIFSIMSPVRVPCQAAYGRPCPRVGAYSAGSKPMFRRYFASASL